MGENTMFLTCKQPNIIKERGSKYDPIILNAVNDPRFKRDGVIIINLDYVAKIIDFKNLHSLVIGLRDSVERLDMREKIKVSTRTTKEGKQVFLIDPRKFRS